MKRQIRNDFYEFDVESTTWRSVAPLDVWPSERAFAGLASIGSQLFLIGGERFQFLNHYGFTVLQPHAIFFLDMDQDLIHKMGFR